MIDGWGMLSAFQSSPFYLDWVDTLVMLWHDYSFWESECWWVCYASLVFEWVETVYRRSFLLDGIAIDG